VSEIVFVLGAGASVHAGAPVMANFLEVARDIERSIDPEDPIKTDYQRVRKAIYAIQRVQSKAKVDLHNLEAVFTILESALTVKKLAGFEPDDIPQAIASFKKVITHTLDSRSTLLVQAKGVQFGAPLSAVAQKTHFFIGPSRDYNSFARAIKEIRPTRSVSVITFNYDVGVDFALSYNGIFPNYNLPDTPIHDDGLSLIKPHGSLNWAKEKDSDRIIALDTGRIIEAQAVPKPHISPSPFTFAFGSRISEHIRAQQQLEVEDTPVLVPPGIYKADHHRALNSVWRAAAKELSEAEDIIVIGFSLPTTDSFFNHLYALGTEGESIIRRFWVYNPDRKVVDRFMTILGEQALPRFRYKEADFSDAIRDLWETYQPKR